MSGDGKRHVVMLIEILCQPFGAVAMGPLLSSESEAEWPLGLWSTKELNKYERFMFEKERAMLEERERRQRSLKSKPALLRVLLVYCYT